MYYIRMTSLAEKFKKYNFYFIELLVLSLPLLMGNMGHTLIGASDIFVVAKYNINSLAAISISNSILFTIFIFPLGILDSVSIVLSNWRGKKLKIKKYLPSTLFFASLIAVIFTLICFSTRYFIDYMGFDNEIVPYIKEYISIVSFSMLGMFLFQGIKQFLQAYEIVKLPNIIILSAVVVNLILNIILVFGYCMVPAMGSKGAAIATLIIRSLMAVVLLIYTYKFLDLKNKIDFSYIKQLIKIGIPIGLALMLEYLAFNIITVLLGREASTLSAVHSILITISSITFMVPLSVATALSIKVAYNYGAERYDEIKNYSITAMVMGVGFMAVSSLILTSFPKEVLSLFTDNPEVYGIALPVVVIVGMFQVLDGFQVISGGILKGFKMTKTVSFCVLTGYWLVGVPVSYICVYKLNYSIKGYWIALAFSILFMGLIQACAAKYKYNLRK